MYRTALFILFAYLAFAQANDSFLILRGTSDHSITSMSEQYVVDLISHVNGLGPVHQQTNRNEFPQTNLFSSPSANVFIALEATTPELLNQATTKFFNIENDKTVQIPKSAYPEDSLSTLTTLLTGEDYNTHGINGHSWKGSRDVSVPAFSKNGNCRVPKIVDHMAVFSEGSARTISVSGSQQMAAALGVHTDLVQQHPEWNCEALYFSKKRGLVDLYTDETVENFGQIGKEATERSMTLKTLEGHLLAAELSAIASIPARLMAMPKTSDSTDFIGIGITSIRALTLKYGADSPQVLDALRLLDIELTKMFAELDNMYTGDIVSEIVGLGSSVEEHTFYTQPKQQRKLVNDTPTGGSGTTGTYTPDEVTAFQTKFWVAITLIIAAFLATWALVKMDMLENSLIYRSTDGPRPIPDVS